MMEKMQIFSGIITFSKAISTEFSCVFSVVC